MFRAHEVWRHCSCIDIDLAFLKVQYRCATYTKARVAYLNRHAILPENRILGVETVVIRSKDYDKWRLVR